MLNPPATTPHISDVTSDNLYQDETFPVARYSLLVARCSLSVERGSLAIFSWSSQAIASMLRKRQQTRPLIAILPDLATRVNGFHQNCISICAGLILPEDARQSKAHEDFWRDH